MNKNLQTIRSAQGTLFFILFYGLRARPQSQWSWAGPTILLAAFVLGVAFWDCGAVEASPRKGSKAAWSGRRRVATGIAGFIEKSTKVRCLDTSRGLSCLPTRQGGVLTWPNHWRRLISRGTTAGMREEMRKR